MSYQVFARKYRPQTFDDVVGQEHVTQTLKNAIEKNRLAHAYLFVGPRGIGKTSTARILAKALNCVKGPTINPCGQCDACREIAAGTSLDVLEFDAASNTQVDKIREIIIDNVKYSPTHGKFKMYIVDEVHMLSNSSFNALLKTLEEPPAHVKFIFATTDVQKVPTTILSRCQRFELKRIPAPLIARHLLHIAANERIALAPEAAQAIAVGAEGGLRDAESMLDQLVAFCGAGITEADVLSVFGFTAQEVVAKLCESVLVRATPEALALVNQQAEAGKDLLKLLGDLLAHLRNLLISKVNTASLQADVSPETVAALEKQGPLIDGERLIGLIDQFSAAESRMKWAPNKKMHFEIALIKAIHSLGQVTLTDVVDTLAGLRGSSSSPAPQLVAGTAAPAAPGRAPVVESSSTPAVAETPRAAPAPPGGRPSTINAPFDGGAVWREVQSQVRKERPLIRCWTDGAVFLAANRDQLLIGIPSEQSLAVEMLGAANNRTFLDKLASEVAGRPVTLKFEARDGLPVSTPPAREPGNERDADPMASFKNDPLIQKALERFKGEIQSVEQTA